MAIYEAAVLEELKHVVDPEYLVNIVDLGLIYAVQLKPRDDGVTDVCIEMTMTSPACPAAPMLVHDATQAVKDMEGVGDLGAGLRLGGHAPGVDLHASGGGD